MMHQASALCLLFIQSSFFYTSSVTINEKSSILPHSGHDMNTRNIQSSVEENVKFVSSKFIPNHQRRLDDLKPEFKELDEILKSSSVQISRTEVTDLPFPLPSSSKLILENVECNFLGLDEITDSFQDQNRFWSTYSLGVIGFDLSCNFNWSFVGGRLGDGEEVGSGVLLTNGNTLDIVFRFVRRLFSWNNENDEAFPPQALNLRRCLLDLDFSLLEFEGGTLANILTTLDNVVGLQFQREIRDIVCQQVETFSQKNFTSTLEGFINRIEPYLQPQTSIIEELNLPEGIDIVDFSDTDTGIGQIVTFAATFIGQILGDTSKDETGPGINSFLKDNFLDLDSIWSFDLSNFILDAQDVPLEVQQSEASTIVTGVELKTLRIKGLDSFSVFDIFQIQGPQTIKSKFQLEILEIEIDVEISIQSNSNLDFSVNEDIELDSVRLEFPAQNERITIFFKVDGIDADGSLFTAIDFEKISNLQIGSLLNLTNIPTCLTSTSLQTTLADTLLSIGNYQIPRISGLLSNGVDTIVSNIIANILSLYGDMVDSSVLENFVTEKAREIFDSKIEELSLGTCPQYAQDEAAVEFIDFRDAFLSPSEAMAAGASGESPLGDSHILKSYVERTLLQSDENGLPLLNEQVIRPITQKQSNVTGTFSLKDDQFLATLPLCIGTCEDFELYAIDASIENLDSVAFPFQILSPSESNPYIIENEIVIGTSSKPLRASLDLLVTTGNWNKHLAISLELSQVSFFASILAKIKKQSLMGIPLSEISNINCWIAAIQTLILDENGFALETDNYPSFAIADIEIDVKNSAKLEIECIDCENTALGMISEGVRILSSVGTADRLIRKMLNNTKVLMETFDIQFQIDQVIQVAAINCPIHELYDTDKTLTGYAFERNIPLLIELMELAVFTAMIIIQIIMFAVPEMIILDDVKMSTPITESDPNSLLSETEYLDFTDSTSLLASLIQSGVTLVKDQLLTMREGLSNDKKDEISINTLLRESLLDDTRKYDIPLSGVSFTQKGITLSIDNIEIMGLDSINEVEAFDIISSQSILTDFNIEKLNMLIKMSITTESQTAVREDILGRRMEESQALDLVFEVEFDDIDVGALLHIGFVRLMIEGLSLESFLFIDKMIPCILSTIGFLEFSEFRVSIGNFKVIEQSKFLSDSDRDELLNSYQALFQNGNEGVQRSLDIVIDQIARPQLNQAISRTISNATCPASERIIESDFIDFRDFLLNATTAKDFGAFGKMPFGDLASSLFTFFNENIVAANQNGLSNVNRFIPNSIKIPGDILDVALELNEFASIDDVASIRIANFSISNLDTVGHPLEILAPRDGESYILDNKVLLGYGDEPIRISFRIIQSFSGDTANMKNEIEVEIEIQKLILEMSLFAKIDSRSLFDFPISDLGNFQCWLATIPSQAESLGIYGVRVSGSEPNLMLEDIDYQVEHLTFAAKCISCSSSDLVEFVDAISALDENSTISQSISEVMNYTADVLIGRLAQIKLDRMIEDAHEKCPHKNSSSVSFEDFTVPSVETNALEVTIGISSLYLFIAIFIITTSFCIRRSVRRNNKQWLLSLSAEDSNRFHSWNISKENRERDLSAQTSALFKSEDVDLFSRYLVPCIVLANIALFLSGHLNLGGAVVADLRFAGELISIPNFFEFSVAESVREMWTSGVKSLAVIIFLLSVLWPYCRQIVLLFLWISPPSRLSVQRRDFILNQLDSLGKWSIVDIYLLMLSLVCFRISVQSPSNHEILPENFYGLDVMLVPLWGLYANMIAQLVSQLSSHFVIFHHKRVLRKAKERLGEEADDSKLEQVRKFERDKKTSLKDENFNTFGMYEGKVITIRQSSKILIFIVGVVTIALLVIGCSLPSFRIDIIGLASELIKAGEESQSASQSFSIFDIVKTVMDQALYLNSIPHYVGLASFCILFLSTTLMTPLILTSILLSIWFLPMSSISRDRLLSAINILKAWQYLEVYIISVFLAMWQVGDISEIMVEDVCGSLDQLFTTLFFLGVLSEENARCFYSNVDVETGFYLLILTSITLNWLTGFTLHATTHQSEVSLYPELENNINNQEIEEKDTVKNSEKRKKRAPVRFTDRSKWAIQFTDKKSSEFDSHSQEYFEEPDNDDEKDNMYLKSLRREENLDQIEVAIAMEPIKGPHFNVSILPAQNI